MRTIRRSAWSIRHLTLHSGEMGWILEVARARWSRDLVVIFFAINQNQSKATLPWQCSSNDNSVLT